MTFTSESRPTSFAVDAYRILKRAGADKTIVFEFRADQAGTLHRSTAVSPATRSAGT